jgi:O-antigen/teichoic acid export membrane protein
MSTVRNLFKGSIFRNAELCVVLASYVVVTPVIVHALGDRLYGFWTLLGAFIGYYGLMDFGLSSAAARYLSQSLGKEDLDDLNGVANTAFFLFSLIGAAVLLLAALIAWACPAFVSDPSEVALLRRIILMTGVATAIGFPLRVYTGVLTAYLRYDVIAYLSIAKAVLSNAAICWLLWWGEGIMAVAAVSVAASLLQNAAVYASCRARYPRVRIIPFRYDPAKVRLMFQYSWKTFVCQLGDVLRFRLDSLLIAGFLNVGLLTPFSIGVRLVDGLCYVVHNSVGMMIPVFSRYEGRGDYDAIRSALLKVTRLSSLLSAFVGFSVIFYGRSFMLRWLGPGFDSSYIVAAILCVGFLFELPQTPGVQLLYGLSRHQYYAVLYVCEGVVNLILSLIFLKRYGMYGVALGTAVEMVVFKLLVQPAYICRVIGLPLKEYLGDMIVGTLVKSAVPLGIYFFLIKDLLLPDYTRLAACVAVQALVFAPAAYFFILSETERRFISHALGFDKPLSTSAPQEDPAA